MTNQKTGNKKHTHFRAPSRNSSSRSMIRPLTRARLLAAKPLQTDCIRVARWLAAARATRSIHLFPQKRRSFV